jgi:hypothetical protein
MIYNLQRHIDLLKLERSENLKNKEEKSELTNYNIDVGEQLFWDYKEEVFLFIDNFLSKKIDGELFCDYVHGFRYKFISKSEELIKDIEEGKIKEFSVDPQIAKKRASRILTDFFCDCDYFDDDYDNIDLYNCIKERRLQFQKFIEVE